MSFIIYEYIVIRMIKKMRMRLERHVAGMGRTRKHIGCWWGT
jgi:hypothetical protein